MGRAILQPGWRWSVDVQPNVGTPSCQAHHFHIVLRGSFAARMDDGEEAVFTVGDICDIPPGHDAWVVGDEVAEILDIAGNVEEFGTPALHTGTVVTLLMTDIVGSTELAEPGGTRRGARSWSGTTASCARSWTGSGARRSTRPATGSSRRSRARSPRSMPRARSATPCGACGVEVRIGVHTGEVELAYGDVKGLAVHAAARVMAFGGASEVIVSGVTRALGGGGPFAFEALGEHQLKGIAAPMDLYRLR